MASAIYLSNRVNPNAYFCEGNFFGAVCCRAMQNEGDVGSDCVADIETWLISHDRPLSSFGVVNVFLSLGLGLGLDRDLCVERSDGGAFVVYVRALAPPLYLPPSIAYGA